MICSRTKPIFNTSDHSGLFRLTAPRRLSRQRQSRTAAGQATIACIWWKFSQKTSPPLRNSPTRTASCGFHRRTTCRAADLSGNNEQRYKVRHIQVAEAKFQCSLTPFILTACRKDIDKQIAWLAIPVRAHETS